MNNPVCAVCGHVNRVGAAACEACDARLYEPAAADAYEPFGEGREPYDAASEPSASSSESSWTASESSWTAPEPDGADAPRPGEAIPAPPFKGVGDVISPMLALYRKHFTLIGILVLVSTLPEALLQYGVIKLSLPDIEDVAGPAGAARQSLAGFVAAGTLLTWLVTMACTALLSGSLVHAVVDVQRAGRSSAGECLARGLKALPKVLVVTLITAVVTIVGYVMLIVPGVILSLMFAVCVPVAIVEGRGPIDAMKRSNELTKGYKGLIFVTYFLWGLLTSVVSWLVIWSFANEAGLGVLPTLLLQTAVLGMLNSSLYALTVYIYLGLLRERQTGFQTNTFTP